VRYFDTNGKLASKDFKTVVTAEARTARR